MLLTLQALISMLRSYGAKSARGTDELIPFFVPYWRRVIIEEPLKAYRKLVFQQGYLDKVEAFPFTRELFQKMKKSGIETALASSANEDELETYKAIAQISDLVDTSTTADDVKRSKPHPDIFETALRKRGVRPSRALALGGYTVGCRISWKSRGTDGRCNDGRMD
jgi:beta-phosphoglucomutase-like phosphatase (HAD superfamily)